MIAAVVGKELNYTMVDFHSSRPGHDLRYINQFLSLQTKPFTTRYAISGELLKGLGWEPSTKLSERIAEFTNWMLDNPRWLDKPLF